RSKPGHLVSRVQASCQVSSKGILRSYRTRTDDTCHSFLRRQSRTPTLSQYRVAAVRWHLAKRKTEHSFPSRLRLGSYAGREHRPLAPRLEELIRRWPLRQPALAGGLGACPQHMICIDL